MSLSFQRLSFSPSKSAWSIAMPISNKPAFPVRYQKALSRFLLMDSKNMGAPVAAHRLGLSAFAGGMNARDLGRVHSRCLAAVMEDMPGSSGAAPKRYVARARCFLAEALTPVVRATANLKKVVVGPEALAVALKERTRELVAARVLIRKAAVLRESSDKALEFAALHYQELLARSQLLQEQSRQLARKVLLAQEEERREISRELHDEVAQILAGINVHLSTLSEASAVNNRSLRSRILQTQRLVERSVQVVHRYARELRPVMLDDLGLIPALRSYIKDLPGRGKLKIRFSAFAGVEALSNSRRTVLYRVAQESLTNVTRHAHAKAVSVSIRQSGGSVLLEVHDNGRSFLADRILGSTTNKRLGLVGMRERVEMCGGTFSIDSHPGKGTTVKALLPYRKLPSKESP